MADYARLPCGQPWLPRHFHNLSLSLDYKFIHSSLNMPRACPSVFNISRSCISLQLSWLHASNMRNTSPPQHPEQALVRCSNATCCDDRDPESLTPCRDTLKRRRNSRPHTMFGTTLFTNGQNQRFYPRFNLLIQPIINIACLAVQGVGDQEARATENARHHLDSLPRGSEVRPLLEPKRVNKLPSKKAGSAQKNAGDPFDVPFTCSIGLSQLEIRSREQRNKLMNLFRQMLMPDGPQACNIFLCSGKDTSCDIISTSVPPEADETEIWRAMNEAWYHHRGLWRKYIPMFGVNEVQKVKVAIPCDLLGCVIYANKNTRFQSLASSVILVDE